jgi:hypothetical protein
MSRSFLVEFCKWHENDIIETERKDNTDCTLYMIIYVNID